MTYVTTWPYYKLAESVLIVLQSKKDHVTRINYVKFYKNVTFSVYHNDYTTVNVSLS